MSPNTGSIHGTPHALPTAVSSDPHAHVADGAIVTACQQACPTGAIIFGDINDPSTRVSHAKAMDRDYALLSWVNSHPRTTYLARITNPNPELYIHFIILYISFKIIDNAN